MSPGKMNLRGAETNNRAGGSLMKGPLANATRRFTVLLFLIFWGIILCAATAGFAKDKPPQTRTVRGVTTDEADNLIQGAAIELTDLQTKKVLDIFSGPGGQYQFTDLRFDHDYTVKATYKNLSSDARQISSLDVRTPLEMNLILRKAGK